MRQMKGYENGSSVGAVYPARAFPPKATQGWNELSSRLQLFTFLLYNPCSILRSLLFVSFPNQVRNNEGYIPDTTVPSERMNKGGLYGLPQLFIDYNRADDMFFFFPVS